MPQKSSDCAPDLIKLAGEIVAAYVSNNSVPVLELPRLIQGVHSAISAMVSGGSSKAAISADEIKKPAAVQIRNSVRPGGIVSFIDGKNYKTLKRHLSANGFDPKSYRERFGLPADYPMVAPKYAEKRSALAKAIGLGVPDSRRSA